jgi:hypothetical protein
VKADPILVAHPRLIEDIAVDDGIQDQAVAEPDAKWPLLPIFARAADDRVRASPIRCDKKPRLGGAGANENPIAVI